MSLGRPELKPQGELKPCPFCGGTRLVVVKLARYDMVRYEAWKDDSEAYSYNVHCVSCAADGPWKKSQSGAETYWNGIPGTPQGRARFAKKGELNDVQNHNDG